jgi:hypothetical protein
MYFTSSGISVECYLYLFLNLTPLIPLSFNLPQKERGKIKKRGFAPLKRLADLKKDLTTEKSSIYDFSAPG